jgi:hypothetical protein
MNCGKIWIVEGGEPWRRSHANSLPKADEFRAHTREIDSFLRGFCSAKNYESSDAYVQGDFFGERTHVVILSERMLFALELTEALLHWLSVPRRKSWRVVLAGRRSKEDTVVVYPDAIVASPKISDYRIALRNRE